MFCPICEGKLCIRDYEKSSAWGFCPQCGWSNFIIKAILKNRNIPWEKFIENKSLQKTFSMDEEVVKALDAQCEFHKTLGSPNTMAREAFYEIGKRLNDGVELPQKHNPPFLKLSRDILEKIKPYYTSRSSFGRKQYKGTGIAIPLYQNRNELVGYNYLLKNPYNEESGFRWATYLHNFYLERSKAYLCYRPKNFRHNMEIILVDSLTKYLQMAYWYDTGNVKNGTVFVKKTMPLLMLGDVEKSLDYLFGYHWNPYRITLVTMKEDIREPLLERVRYSTHSMQVRLLPYGENNKFTQLLKCRNVDRFESLVEQNMVEVFM